MRSDLDFALLRSFAAELKARRMALGISQEQLALRAEVNRTFVGKMETAKNQPTLAVMYRLSQGLDCEMPELLSSVLKRYRREVRNLAKHELA
jgi:transcriptional regulator with XRE-family HTH domain